MYLTFSLLLPCTYSQNKGCYISWVTSGTEQKGNNGSNAFMIVHQNTYRRVTFTFSEISNYWQESLLELIRQNIAGWCNKLFVFKTLWTMTSNIFAIHLNQTFLPIILIFTEGEGDGIKSRLPLRYFLFYIKNFIFEQQILTRLIWLIHTLALPPKWNL